MKKILFQYAVLLHKSTGKGKDDFDTSVIVEPTNILSKSASQVGMLAARSIPEVYIDQLENVDIVVRPF